MFIKLRCLNIDLLMQITKDAEKSKEEIVFSDLFNRDVNVETKHIVILSPLTPEILLNRFGLVKNVKDENSPLEKLTFMNTTAGMLVVQYECQDIIDVIEKAEALA